MAYHIVIYVEFTNGTHDWLSLDGYLYFLQRGQIRRSLESQKVRGY